MFKKLLIISFSSITLLLSGSKFYDIPVMKNKNMAISVTYTKSIVNDQMIVGMFLDNLRRDAKFASATMSFPQFEDKIGYSLSSKFDSLTHYTPPTKLKSSILKRKVKLKYYMVQGITKGFHAKKSKYFMLKVKVPSTLKYLVVRVRGILLYGSKSRKPRYSMLPSKSSIKDHEGYYVYDYKIPLDKLRENSIGENGDKEKGSTTKRVPKKYATYTGTGFFINNNMLITNNHVVKGCTKISIKNNDLDTFSAKVKTVDTKNDLAVLKVDTSSSSYLEFRKSKIELGEKIISLGYPLGSILGDNVKLTIGNVSSLNGLRNDVTRIQFTAPIQHGNSGGPLLGKYGNLIGVTYATLNDKESQNVNLAIKNNIVKMFLDSYDIPYHESDSQIPLDTVDIVKKRKSSIVKVICEVKR